MDSEGAAFGKVWARMKITIPITPVGQMRARSTAVNGRARTYKAPKQRANENEIMVTLTGSAPKTPITGPLEVTVDAYLPVPKTFSRMKKAMALGGELRPTTKPDADNLGKNILDCMNGLVWEDDRQIVGLMVRKFYSDNPRWEVEIRAAGGADAR